MPSDPGRSFYSAALRGAYQEPPYARRSYDDYGGSTLGDLIGRQGQLQAQRHIAGSDMLARGVQEAGQQIAGYFSEKAEKQEMAKRDAATMAAIEAWDGQDPMQLYKGLAKVRGPADSLQYTNTVLALRKGPQKDPEKELERFGKIAQFMKDQPDEVIAKAWPAIRASIGSTAAQLGLGDAEQWDPKFRPIVAKAGELFGPKQEKAKLQGYAPGTAVLDEDGQLVFKVPEKPRDPKTVETVDAQGRPITKAVTDEELAAGVPKYQAPRAPLQPNLQRIETIGPNGETVQTFVEPRPGASYPSPAKAAPQQRLTKDERQHFAAQSYALPRVEKFAEYVRQNPGKWGRWDASRETVKQYVPGLADADYASEAAFVGRMNAEIRHALFGASLTEGEQESAKDFLINKGDQPQVILAKLQEATSRARSDMEYYRGLGFNMPQGGGGSGPVRVNSKAEFDKLPSGALFVGPSGKTRRKP